MMKIIILILLLLIVIVICNTNVVNDNNNINYALELYKLAYKIYSNSNHTINNDNNKNIKIHLIRVPKASSTSLSVVARRIVGCTPPGIIIMITTTYLSLF